MVNRPRVRVEKSRARSAYLGLFIEKLWSGVGVARVVTGSVCLPDVDEDIWQGLACLNIDNTNVEQKKQTILHFGNILPDRMADVVIVRTFRHLRG